jgi:hypothetical protein
VGDGEVEDVAPEVYGFEVSGFLPVESWLGFRQKNRRGRRSSPLDDVVPSEWTADLGRELLELLWVLEKTLEIYPEQKELLQKVLEGPLFTVDELPAPTPEQRREPGGKEEKPQEAEAVGEEEGENGAEHVVQPRLLSLREASRDGVYGNQP